MTTSRFTRLMDMDETTVVWAGVQDNGCLITVVATEPNGQHDGHLSVSVGFHRKPNDGEIEVALREFGMFGSSALKELSEERIEPMAGATKSFARHFFLNKSETA